VFENMKFTKNDEAVSPVIGVILMVAITVILAAVIAAFVFGMAGNINKTKVVSVTLSRDSAGITAVYQGGQDAPALQKIVWTANGAAAGSEGTAGGTNTLKVGRTYALTGTANAGLHVVGVGYFNDNTQQVIADTTV
jgi:flagellin-like protein